MKKYLKYIIPIIISTISLVLFSGCTTDETGAAGIQWWGVILAVVLAFVMFKFFGKGKGK